MFVRGMITHCQISCVVENHVKCLITLVLFSRRLSSVQVNRERELESLVLK